MIKYIMNINMYTQLLMFAGCVLAVYVTLRWSSSIRGGYELQIRLATYDLHEKRYMRPVRMYLHNDYSISGIWGLYKLQNQQAPVNHPSGYVAISHHCVYSMASQYIIGPLVYPWPRLSLCVLRWGCTSPTMWKMHRDCSKASLAPVGHAGCSACLSSSADIQR